MYCAVKFQKYVGCLFKFAFLIPIASAVYADVLLYRSVQCRVLYEIEHTHATVHIGM